jgi:non-specific protein-tyrosine kinase
MTLKDYITPFRKWWWLILITTIIAIGSSFLVTQRQAPNYRASTTLLIGNALADPNPSGGDFVLGEQLAQTYVDLANLAQLRAATMENLGLANLPDYTVSHQPNTQLIKIDVTDTNPERAMAVANELAKQLILRTPAAADQDNIARQQFVNEELDDLQVEIRETKDRITEKQAELAESFSAREISDLQDEISTLENKLNAMQTNYASLLASTQQGAANVISVVQEATLPQRPVGPNQRLTVLATGLIGFILATGAAYLLVYLDDTIQSPEEIENLTGLSTLAGIARIKPQKKNSLELITIKQPRSPISEAFRGLRTGIQFSDVDARRRLLLVTSAAPSEGKSLVASNLAVVTAQSGHSTLLIDADLRRPVQHRFYNINKERGLTNLLLALELNTTTEVQEQTLKEFIRPTPVPGLHLLPSGSIPPNPSELLGSSKMKEVLRILSNRFDYVIIDSPPILPVTDAVVLSTLVQSVLLVVSAGHTARNQLKRSAERLREVNAKVIGSILNGLTRKNDAYSYYYYYQGNYYAEEEHTVVDDGRLVPEHNGESNGLVGRFPWRKHRMATKNE